MAKFSECYGTFVDSRFWFISLSATMILNWHELNDQKSISKPTGIIESKSVAVTKGFAVAQIIQISNTKKALIEWLGCLYGAGTKSRTRDLLILSRVSQLRLTTGFVV
ncbi:hypothetical protein [Shewanella baltica]|uniref:hypothetical protein n=2 Tax=Shewanella baltica TaxID=62322 RepID=UPI00217EE7BC|nr:hypothetical protein [Shewanella baltica]